MTNLYRLDLENNNLINTDTYYDADFVTWLNQQNPDWHTQISPSYCGSSSQALVEIYNSTNGDLWNVTNTPCSWYGIQCSGGHVAILYLQYNQLSGTIPAEIENLSYLEVINIRNNDLCGNIPVGLMNLDHLWALSLDYNHLSASEPELIDWLNNLNPGWETTQTSCPEPSSF